MIGRGNLSKEIPIEKVPFTQKVILDKARRYKTGVSLATKLLETMAEKRNATRAEGKQEGQLAHGLGGGGLFSRLLGRRYEKASLILTSNKSFADWVEISNDLLPATAILHRLLHHSTVLNIKGVSYRLKEKGKAGLPSYRIKQKEVVPASA